MGFQLEKLYADLITPDGTVCVAYVAWLRAYGTRSAHAGLELYWPDGSREVVHARPDPQRTHTAGEFELSFDVPGGPFVLTYRVLHGAWTPEGDSPCDGLRWCVKAARAEAVGRWMNDPARPELRGVGYSDWVEIERPTRGLGLDMLQWGRVHLPDATLVWTAVDFRSGPAWHRAAQWSDSGTAAWDTFGIHAAQAKMTVTLPGHPDLLCITPARALHAGDAIDRARFPSLLERTISRAATGPVTERRSLGRVGSSWALHEAVRFGPRAAR